MNADPPAAAASALAFEQLQIGQRFTTASHTVTAEQITAFATQFDPQPFHLDAAAARASLFGGLVASGWHTAAITMRLLVDSGLRLAGGSVGLGVTIEWLRPVRPGDRLHVESEIIELTPSRSRADRARITTRNLTRTADGTIVQVAVSRMLVSRTPPAD